MPHRTRASTFRLLVVFVLAYVINHAEVTHVQEERLLLVTFILTQVCCLQNLLRTGA